MFRVTVQHMQETFEVETEGKETIEELRKKIAEKTQVPAGRQRLTYRGGVLSDSAKTVEECGVAEGGVIYMNKTEVAKGPKEIQGHVYTKPEAPPGMNIMKDPNMKKLFSNPEIMKEILEMFPEMKKENPELKKLMESSQMLEEMAKLAEDPEYMNTQMKNVDIAMAKLETMPGGFNMLRSMLKTQKDPNSMLAEGADSTIFKEGSITEEEKGQPAPNPWGKKSFNPIVAYRKQVEYMKECGFTDIEENIKLLVKHKGNVDGAISEILAHSMHARTHSHSPISDQESQP
ncbi:ubiquilin [Nematocida sp. AWRm77]|nr:ubiquilin [Nematocida sp. AWRm77]